MRLIDADALKELPFHRLTHTDWGETCVSFEEIDNAPTVEIFCHYQYDGEVKEPCVEAPCPNCERPQGMTNAELFKQTFGIYATELWTMTNADFMEWLNADMREGDGS